MPGEYASVVEGLLVLVPQREEAVDDETGFKGDASRPHDEGSLGGIAIAHRFAGVEVADRDLHGPHARRLAESTPDQEDVVDGECPVECLVDDRAEGEGANPELEIQEEGAENDPVDQIGGEALGKGGQGAAGGDVEAARVRVGGVVYALGLRLLPLLRIAGRGAVGFVGGRARRPGFGLHEAAGRFGPQSRRRCFFIVLRWCAC